MARFIPNKVKKQVSDGQFGEAWSHKDMTLFPLMIRFFRNYFFTFIANGLQKHGLTEKVVGFGAENASSEPEKTHTSGNTNMLNREVKC